MASKICQSCSMPLNDLNRGTEVSGDLSEKYCELCYKEGKFVDPEISLMDMEELVADILQDEKHWPGFAAKMASRRVKNLERWHEKNGHNRTGSIYF